MTKLIIFSLIVILIGFTMIDTCAVEEGITNYVITKVTETEPEKLDDIDNAQSISSEHDNTNHHHILQQHVDLQGMRHEMRKDLIEIQKGKNSHYAEQKLAYDRTIYGTLLLTVIATCLIYFIFVEL